jgi:hypothetical protein
MPAGSLANFANILPPPRPGQSGELDDDIGNFIATKIVKKGGELLVDRVLYTITLPFAIAFDVLFAGSPLGEGEERALDQQFAAQRQEAIARGEQLGALASDVSTSDP